MIKGIEDKPEPKHIKWKKNPTEEDSSSSINGRIIHNPSNHNQKQKLSSKYQVLEQRGDEQQI